MDDRGLSRALDGIVFSSGLVAAAAAGLAGAVGRALAGGVPPAVPALAFCGTFAIYNLDRLRDLERDRAASPRRTAFVAAHHRALTALAGAAAAACVPLAVGLGPGAAAVLAPALVLGLLHRRLKGVAVLKPVYLTGSWLLVVVGLPRIATGPTAGGGLGWASAVVGLSLFANAMASNAAGAGRDRTLRGARVAAVVALGCAALAPAPVHALAAVPLATFAALAFFDASERSRLAVLDGALALGAALAWGALL